MVLYLEENFWVLLSYHESPIFFPQKTLVGLKSLEMIKHVRHRLNGKCENPVWKKLFKNVSADVNRDKYSICLNRKVQHHQNILSPIICILKATLIKTIFSFFLEPGRLIIKFIWNSKSARLARKSPNKKWIRP